MGVDDNKVPLRRAKREVVETTWDDIVMGDGVKVLVGKGVACENDAATSVGLRRLV